MLAGRETVGPPEAPRGHRRRRRSRSRIRGPPTCGKAEGDPCGRRRRAGNRWGASRARTRPGAGPAGCWPPRCRRHARGSTEGSARPAAVGHRSSTSRGRTRRRRVPTSGAWPTRRRHQGQPGSGGHPRSTVSSTCAVRQMTSVARASHLHGIVVRTGSRGKKPGERSTCPWSLSRPGVAPPLHVHTTEASRGRWSRRRRPASPRCRVVHIRSVASPNHTGALSFVRPPGTDEVGSTGSPATPWTPGWPSWWRVAFVAGTDDMPGRMALLVAGLPLVMAVRRLVIEPEEHYLAERYGPIYADYRRSVRRWL